MLGDATEVAGEQQSRPSVREGSIGLLKCIEPSWLDVARERWLVDLNPFDAHFLQTRQNPRISSSKRLEEFQAVEAVFGGLGKAQEGKWPDQHRLHRFAAGQRLRDIGKIQIG